jgi:hypothetical protein
MMVSFSLSIDMTTNEKKTLLTNICREILSSDNAIRYVGIANKMGKLVASELRQGKSPLLSNEDIASSAIKSVLRMRTREDYELKLGRAIYTFTLYEKVKRASIPLEDDDYALLLISFEKPANHESIILEKVLPILQRYNLI